jgi:hypothetical protein
MFLASTRRPLSPSALARGWERLHLAIRCCAAERTADSVWVEQFRLSIEVGEDPYSYLSLDLSSIHPKTLERQIQPLQNHRRRSLVD